MPPIKPLGKRQGIGFRLYRTDAEMREVVLSNPFLAADVDEEHLHAIFLAEAPAPSNAASLDRSSRKLSSKVPLSFCPVLTAMDAMGTVTVLNRSSASSIFSR